VRAVDVSIVTFRPDITLLEKLLASIAEQATGLTLNVLILDNSPDHAMLPTIAALPHLQPNGAFLRVDVKRSPTNVGFGRGHNANAARCTAPFLFVLNQDCILEPGVLAPLLELANGDARRIAAWELRQIPYEHPKAYDPVTQEVPWVSGAATLFRRSTFDAVGGFDPALFMYGEDVDLSWRLRAKGFRLRYVPQYAVVHRTYAAAGEVKPLQVLGGVETNLCLRARYGGFARTLQGISMVGAEMLAHRNFPDAGAGSPGPSSASSDGGRISR
jgi:GT2 family glycosyltransferase